MILWHIFGVSETLSWSQFTFWSTEIAPSYNIKRYIHKSWPYYKIGMLFSQDPPFVTLPMDCPMKTVKFLPPGTFCWFIPSIPAALNQMVSYKYIGWKENPIWSTNGNTEGRTGSKFAFALCSLCSVSCAGSLGQVRITTMPCTTWIKSLNKGNEGRSSWFWQQPLKMGQSLFSL